MNNFLNKSINRQFLFPLVIVIILSLIGAFILTYISQSVHDEMVSEQSQLKEKQLTVKKIDDHLTLMFFHARGYYLLKSENELIELNDKKELLEEKVKQYQNYKLTSEEQLFVNELNKFLTYYNKELFPQAVSYIENDNYEALRTLGASGATDSVLTFLGEANRLSEAIDRDLDTLNEQEFKSENLLRWAFVVYIFTILFVLGIVIRQISKSIGNPLSELTQASEQISKGRDVHLTQFNRKDELGILSRTFQEMMKSIQSKEEELMAQNEELIAQQETLEKSILDFKNVNFALNKSSIVAITDNRGVITHVNDKFCEISKYSREELIGKDHRIINSGYHDKGFFRKLWKTILSGQIWSGEIKNKAKDGSLYWVETTIVPYLDYKGKTYQFIAIRTDITSIKLAEQKLKASYEETENRRQLNQDIIDNVNEGIIFLNKNGDLIDYNLKISKMLEDIGNYRNQSFESWSKLFSSRIQDFPTFKDFLRTAISTEYKDVLTHFCEINIPTKKIFEVYAVTVKRQGNRLGTLIVYRDITTEYEVDQMKSELVSTVSHELRTPLSSVLGFTELMLTKDLKKERQKKYLETIHKEASRLTNLINDFLDIQRMESGRQSYQKENINILSVAKEVIKSFQAMNSDHKFMIKSLKDHILVYGDEEKLIQVFTNLISNAVKFSPEGGKVRIYFQTSENDLAVTIEDEGLGIPAEEIPNLFQKFYRIDNSDRRKIGGTGLGLAICKKIIEAHNGQISVTSQLGKGSVFLISLPIVSEIVAKEQHHHQDRPSVVIVEDDESLAMLLTDELKELNLNISCYSECTTAVNAIREKKPELVILDIMLGNSYDGWHVIDRLKNDSLTANIPIIISSALDEKEKGISLGIDHYLTKPYPPSKLSEVVVELFSMGNKEGDILVPVKEKEE